jgi:hypothetical protein
MRNGDDMMFLVFAAVVYANLRFAGPLRVFWMGRRQMSDDPSWRSLNGQKKTERGTTLLVYFQGQSANTGRVNEECLPFPDALRSGK